MLIEKGDLIMEVILSSCNQPLYYKFDNTNINDIDYTFTNQEFYLEITEPLELNNFIQNHFNPLVYNYCDTLKDLKLYLVISKEPNKVLLHYNNSTLRTFLNDLKIKRTEIFENYKFENKDPIKYVYSKEDKVNCPICKKEIKLNEDLNVIEKCEHFIEWRNDIRTYEKMFIFNSEVNNKENKKEETTNGNK